MHLTKQQRLDIIESMLFEISDKGTPKEITIEIMACGVPFKYALNIEQAAINIWNKYGEILLLYLCMPRDDD